MEPVIIEKLDKQIKVTYTGDKPARIILKAEFQTEKEFKYPLFQKAGHKLLSCDSHVWANGRIVYVLGTLQGPPEMDIRRKDFPFQPNILGDKDVYCQDIPSSPNPMMPKAALRQGEHDTPPKGKPKERSKYAVPGKYAFPVNDAGHVRAAMAYFNRHKFATSSERHQAATRILRAAKKFGVKVSDTSLVSKVARGGK